MLCLRCRALPSLRAPSSSARAPMNRLSPFTSQPAASRQFSSLLSSSAIRQPTQMQTSFSKMPTPPTISPSITSLLTQSQLSQAASQGQSQTRAFSASASLGVRRVTFRPSRLVQKRRHGFLARNKSKKGRQTLTRRRVKGRKNMSW